MRGADYVIRRAGFAVLTIFLAITMNFIIFRAVPGDAADTLGQCGNCTGEFREIVRRELGLDNSRFEQYVIYMKGLVKGDLGRSFATRQPVREELKQPLLNTLPMAALAVIFAILLGTLVGVVAAWRRGTFADWGAVSTALIFYALPTQWLGLMLAIAFTGVLPTSGLSDPLASLTDPNAWEVFVDRMRHMILPSLTLGLGLFGQYALITRSAVLETLGEDYILTAKAKGLRSWRVVWRYAFRNALLPTTTLMAVSLGYLVGGAILIETVFSYPGIGFETYQAVFARDYPILQAAFLLLTISVIFWNFVADLLYFKLDPRVTA